MVYNISLQFVPLTSKCSVSQSSELQFIPYGIDMCQESVSAVMPFSPPHHPLLLTIGDCILNLKAFHTWVGKHREHRPSLAGGREPRGRTLELEVMLQKSDWLLSPALGGPPYCGVTLCPAPTNRTECTGWCGGGGWMVGCGLDFSLFQRQPEQKRGSWRRPSVPKHACSEIGSCVGSEACGRLVSQAFPPFRFFDNRLRLF